MADGDDGVLEEGVLNVCSLVVVSALVGMLRTLAVDCLE